jgi:hypothetical protein
MISIGAIQDYDDLIEAIKAYGTWWHHLDSTWIIVTEQTSKQVRDNLVQHIDDNDELLVVKSAGAAWCGFDQSGRAWLRKNI